MLRIVKVKIEFLPQERPLSSFSQESLDFEELLWKLLSDQAEAQSGANKMRQWDP